MGAVEKAQAIANLEYAFNVVIALHLSNSPGKEILENTAAKLCRRHPVLGACILKQRHRYYFKLPSRPNAVPVTIVSRDTETTWRKTAEKRLNRVIGFETGPMFSIDHVTGVEVSGQSELILTFHHAVMDGACGANLLDEFLILCAGKELPPLPNGPGAAGLNPPAEVFFPPSYKGFRKNCHNAVYMMRMMWDELFFRAKTITKPTPPVHNTGTCRILTCSLPEKTSGLLIKQARKERITINRLFDAALLQSVNRHIYKETPLAMRFFTFADLRPFLKPPQPAQVTGSCFSMMRFTAMVRPSVPLPTLARQIQQQVYKALKRGDKFCAHLLSAAVMKMMLKSKSSRMGNTALSHMGGIDLKENYGGIRVKDLRVFTSNFVLGPEYTAQTRRFHNRFNWDIVYLLSDMDQTLAVRIAHDIMESLTAFAQRSVK